MAKKRPTPEQVRREAMQAFYRLSNDRAWALMQSQPQLGNAPMPRSRIPKPDTQAIDNVIYVAPWADAPLPKATTNVSDQTDSLLNTQTKPDPRMVENAIESMEKREEPKPPNQNPDEGIQLRSPVAQEPPNETMPQARATSRQQAPSEPQADRPTRRSQARRSQETASKPKATRRPPRPDKQRVAKPRNYVPGKTPVPAFNNDTFGTGMDFKSEEINFDMEEFRNMQMNGMVGEDLSDQQSVFYEQLVGLMEQHTNQLVLLTMRLRFLENMMNRIGA